MERFPGVPLGSLRLAEARQAPPQATRCHSYAVRRGENRDGMQDGPTAERRATLIIWWCASATAKL